MPDAISCLIQYPRFAASYNVLDGETSPAIGYDMSAETATPRTSVETERVRHEPSRDEAGRMIVDDT
jgi:hypothetical protein